MDILLQIVFAGLVVGAIYALIALGFTLILKVIDMLNFAQGDFLMIGAFAFFGISGILPWPPYITLPLTLALTFLLGMGFARLFILPLRKASGMSLLIVAIGLGIILQDVTRLIFGADARAVQPILGSTVHSLGSLTVTANDIGILAIAAVCVVSLMLFLRTRLGTALRATAADVDIASILGVNIAFIICFTVGLSLAMSSVAGIFLAPRTQLINTMGIALTLRAFTGAVIGGFGSIPGAIIGGFLVGVVENLTSFYVTTAYSQAITFGILVIVLIVRPTGLMGEKTA